MADSITDQLHREILLARQRIYAVSGQTPLDAIDLPGGIQLFLKREDLTPIHAYKWRGSYNRMAVLSPEELERGVVTASAGNHAQGVALAARKLGTQAKIFMPKPTPQTKQVAVRVHGQDAVDIELIGDTFDVANHAAAEEAKQSGRTYVHAYDDIMVMGGQGTLADEIVMSGKGPFDAAYLQIGGGGMAAATACWLKSFYPGIRIVGVEGVQQASMAAAIKAGKPVPLDYIDVFCDGTAVRQAGEKTYPVCRDLIDEFITVTNDEVCAAIRLLWEKRRCVPEPAGAMGLAGILQQQDQLKGQKVISVVCGANMDFGQLAWIARHAGLGSASRRYLRFEIDEHSGTMLNLLETALDGLNIVEFQYGKNHPHKAWPVLGFDISAAEMEHLKSRLETMGMIFEEVTSQEDVEFGIIHYDSDLIGLPHFIKLEFHERPGALHDFLKALSPYGNMCYFNYQYSGERVGRSLIGFEFSNEDERSRFKQVLDRVKETYRSCREIDAKVLERIL